MGPDSGMYRDIYLSRYLMLLKTQFSDYVCIILSEHCFPKVYINIRDKLKLYNRI